MSKKKTRFIVASALIAAFSVLPGAQMASATTVLYGQSGCTWKVSVSSGLTAALKLAQDA